MRGSLTPDTRGLDRSRNRDCGSPSRAFCALLVPWPKVRKFDLGDPAACDRFNALWAASTLPRIPTPFQHQIDRSRAWCGNKTGSPSFRGVFFKFKFRTFSRPGAEITAISGQRCRAGAPRGIFIPHQKVRNSIRPLRLRAGVSVQSGTHDSPPLPRAGAVSRQLSVSHGTIHPARLDGRLRTQFERFSSMYQIWPVDASRIADSLPDLVHDAPSSYRVGSGPTIARSAT